MKSQQEVHIRLYKNSVQLAYINESTSKSALLSLLKELINCPEEDLNQLTFTVSDRGKRYHVNIEVFKKLHRGEISSEELLKKL
ncbi:hypothetical protein EZS27_026483 [termite gut metagenome]|uniref:Uncharacterized protein n=1 Tax=termite gut metagenome TaxID=433724 RepID=A0A5J4QQP7_9ZZZZ